MKVRKLSNLLAPTFAQRSGGLPGYDFAAIDRMVHVVNGFPISLIVAADQIVCLETG
jgi:hypothetical protein